MFRFYMMVSLGDDNQNIYNLWSCYLAPYVMMEINWCVVDPQYAEEYIPLLKCIMLTLLATASVFRTDNTINAKCINLLAE